jgi:ankyrin repeat protein
MWMIWTAPWRQQTSHIKILLNWSGRTETVRILIDAGAGVNEGTALAIAVESGHKEIVRLLIDAGPDLKDTFAFQAAVRNGHLEMVQMLIDAGTDGNIIQKAERTGNTDVIAAAVNVKDVDGARLDAVGVMLPQARIRWNLVAQKK